jgi:hypothetical protein
MPTMPRTNRHYWATLSLGAAIGIVYLIGFLAGGKPVAG